MNQRLYYGVVPTAAPVSVVNRDRERKAADWAARAREAVDRVAARKS